MEWIMLLYQRISTRYPLEKVMLALGLATAILLLLTGAAGAQTGTGQLTVTACHDQNADRIR